LEERKEEEEIEDAPDFLIPKLMLKTKVCVKELQENTRELLMSKLIEILP
jgi:hypothetical protein